MGPEEDAENAEEETPDDIRGRRRGLSSMRMFHVQMAEM